ncbi:hypothetical protein ACFV4P_09345 [Kitasatospora sp. NPDC059795]|uniref:hypothetical protein n=1 Tax=Kitasatospora sp. NPDC059795 TaxID=3346949 RepID=UPI00366522C0
MTATAPLIDLAVLLSAAAGLWCGGRALGGGGAEPGRGGRTVRPEVGMAVVVAAVYVNQLLCAAYVVRVHGGDASFVARYLPPGWFAQPVGSPMVRALAEWLPAPEAFGPSVLRVQAFLELPFVLFAYGTALRRISPALYRAALGSRPLVWAAAASYTVVFGVVEWALRNPWTVQDLAIRAASAAVAAPLLRALARRDRGTELRPGTGGLLHFAVALWALGGLVMVVYDTALLYNSAHLHTRWPELLLCSAVLAVTARWQPADPATVGPATVGPATAALGVVLRRGLVLFLVPALAIRYGLGFADPQVAAGGGLLVAVAALCHRQVRQAGAPLALAATAGLGAAYLALHAVADTYPESGLLRAMVAFLTTAVLVCAVADRRPGARPVASAG